MERAGHKIGFIGIGEKEWVTRFTNLECDLVYQNYKRTATDYAKKLREEEGCTLIIALTHMRVARDTKVAEQVPGIDLVLGGHDHDYFSFEVNQKLEDESVAGNVVPVVKSASDWLDMSRIDLTFGVS